MCYEKLLNIMKDKTDRILELIEDPAIFDEARIRMMLEDPETAEIYRTINKTVDSLIETGEPDLNKEWNAFVEKNHYALKHGGNGIFRQIFSRKISAAIFIAIASLSLLAAGIGIGTTLSKRNSKEGLEIEEMNNHTYDKKSEIYEDTLMSEISTVMEQPIVIYKDESLENILNEIAEHYGVAIMYKNDAVKNLNLYFQWNQSQSLAETLSQLNHFQQINIIVNDNTMIVE